MTCSKLWLIIWSLFGPEVLSAKSGCVDVQDAQDCQAFAATGACMDGPGWSADNCAKSCKLCKYADPRTRCRHENWKDMNLSMTNSWELAGEKSLDAMFASLENRFPEYKPTVLSRPPHGPWVVHFENFVADEERRFLSKYASQEGMKDAAVKGANRLGGYLPGDRTNKNAWCGRKHDCNKNPIGKRLLKRIADLVRVPVANIEDLQILQYKIGQRYETHHDHEGDDTREAFSGPRVLTFFMYFNDVKGGETHFPFINVTNLPSNAADVLADVSRRGLHWETGIAVKPRKGSAVLWSSVGDDLHKQLYETHHAALPVIKGTKYAANAWIHLRDIVTPTMWECTGKPTWPPGVEPGDAPDLVYNLTVPGRIKADIERMSVAGNQEL